MISDYCLREDVEEYLKTWRVVFERHGLKISRTKTAYLPNPTDDSETTLNSATKGVWPLLEARTQPHRFEITKTGSFGEKEQRSTEKEMDEQHKGRHDEIPAD